MKNKLIAVALVVICLMVFPINTVSAADEEYTFDDTIGDVVDEEFDPHPEVKDIDITQIYYSKTGKTVIVEVNFADRIRKLSDTALIIGLIITTSEQDYQIFYQYFKILTETLDEVNGSYSDGYFNVDLTGFNTEKLTFTFDMQSEEETFQDINVTSLKAITDLQQTFTETYSDFYPNFEFLNVDAGGDYEGNVGEEINFSGSVEDGTPPYEYEWDFDDGEISKEQNPTHIYEEAGTYDVTLFVQDSEGSEGFAFATVEISGQNGGNGNGNGDNNDSTNDSSTGLIIFVLLIVIIVIIGVAVVFFVIKK